MGFCGEFFGDFNDWVLQDHHFSFEPSGISKTKVLFQIANIFQVAENVYLPISDGQNDFLVKTFEDVNSASEILERLKKENIERIRGVDIEKVLSTLKEKKPEIPFFFTGPVEQWQKEDANLERILGDKFKNGPVGISVALLTEIRDKKLKPIKPVVTNGSQATTVLLFVHPKKQPESAEAESLDQQTEPLDLSKKSGALDLSKKTGALDLSKKTGPSISEPSASADSSPLKLFTKTEYNKFKSEWVADLNPSFEKCLRGAKCILVQPPDEEEFNSRLTDWQLMLAHLLKKCDEEIERVKIIEVKSPKVDKKINSDMSSMYEGKTLRGHWEKMKKYFNQNSEVAIRNYSNPERPIFLLSSDKTRYHDAVRNLITILCDRGRERVKDLLRPPRDETKYPIGCPHCQKGFTVENSHLLPRHILRDHHYQALRKLQCLVCENTLFKDKQSLWMHLYQNHGQLDKARQKRKTEESSSPGCSKAKRTK